MKLESSGPLTATLWRDHDPEAMKLPGMSLGRTTIKTDTVEQARQMAETGVRRVNLLDAVRTSSPDSATTAQALALIRELTGYGIAVDWHLELGEESPPWQALSHLYPPREVTAEGTGEEVLRQWRRTYHIDKFIFRRGPGFVQIRDWRSGSLLRATIHEPQYLAPINDLLLGRIPPGTPARILTAYTTAGFLTHLDGHPLWLPHRVHRWPFAPMIV